MGMVRRSGAGAVWGLAVFLGAAAFWAWALPSVCLAGGTTGARIVRVRPPNGGTPVLLDLAKVKALPAVSITTFDPWDNKTRRYTGVPLLALLEKMGLADFKYVKIIAANKYQARVCKQYLSKYNYLLTYAMDGRDYDRLGEENKGPLAIAVQMEKVDRADRLKVKNHLVWWISELVLTK